MGDQMPLRRSAWEVFLHPDNPIAIHLKSVRLRRYAFQIGPGVGT